MFGFYTRALANYPLPTQALTTGTSQRFCKTIMGWMPLRRNGSFLGPDHSNIAHLRPILLLTIRVSGTLFSTGDLIAQFFVEHRKTPSESSIATWDKTRTLRMTFFGAVFAGPVLHNWYGLLDRTIRLSTPARSLFGRVVADQMFFAPCFIASFFVGQGLLAGESWETIQERLRKVTCSP